MKKVWALVIGVSSYLFGDVVDREINIGYYKHSASGTIQYKGDAIYVKETLKWNDDADKFVKVYVENDRAKLPNVRFSYAELGHSGYGRLTKSFDFSGTTFSANSNISSRFDLKSYDVSFYYIMPVDMLDVDLGLNLKYADGFLSLKTDNGISEGSDFEVMVPMLYGKVKYDILETGLSLQAEGTYLTYDSDTFYDAEIGLRYALGFDAAIEVGYRTMKYNISSISDLDVDTQFSGTYGQLVWNF